MAKQKHISSVRELNWSNQVVYNQLSSLEFLNILFNPAAIERAKEQMGDKASKFNIQNFIADKDSCSFDLPPMGHISLRIDDREEPKSIRVISEDGSPIAFTLWIQILPISNERSKMRITLHTELNMMMKMVIGKKLEGSADKIADALQQIPYGAMPTA